MEKFTEARNPRSKVAFVCVKEEMQNAKLCNNYVIIYLNSKFRLDTRIITSDRISK